MKCIFSNFQVPTIPPHTMVAEIKGIKQPFLLTVNEVIGINMVAKFIIVVLESRLVIKRRPNVN